MQLTFGSVCSGIEAASVAWEPLGWKAAWFAEVDRAASEVLAHRFPSTSNHGDMTLLAGMIRRREIPAPDVLVGGTPCQAFSLAGRRQGLADARGALTLAYVDLADAINEVRAADCLPPCIEVWENVPGVLSSKDNAFGCFLAGLAGEDQPLVPSGKRWPNAGVVLGPERAIAWRVVDAQYVGLAQRRRRVFVVAGAGAGFDPAAILLEFDGVRRDSPPSRSAGEGLTHPVAPSLTSSGRGVERAGETRGQDPVVGVLLGCDVGLSVRDSGPGRWTQDDVAGSLRVGGDIESAAAILAPVPPCWDGRDVSQTLDAVLHKGQTMPEKNRFPAVLQPIPFDTTQITSPGNYSQPRAGDPCHPLAAGAHPPAIAFVQNSRDEVRLMGGDGQIAGALSAESGSHQTTFIAHPPAIVVHGTQHPIVADDRARALGRNTGQENALVYGVAGAMAVRRLMPVECERLQGFPDGWTDVPTGPKRKLAADGPRYKQLGNSMATNVMRWIGNRLDAWLRQNQPAIGHNSHSFDEVLG